MYIGVSMFCNNLRCEFHFQLARQILPLKLCILANVRGDHPLDLFGLQEQTQAEVVHSGGREGQGERGDTQAISISYADFMFAHQEHKIKSLKEKVH